uniref:Uncharacterized protein n=1 Tax=Panagrolaimus superbus TaxID=310955 RepID=A0A914YRY6_9BILA
MKEQQQNFSKCGFRQFDKTGHTIFAATNPKMYTFFDFTEQMAKKNEMFGATLFTVKKSEETNKIIEKLVTCALEEECMAPRASFLYCIPSKLEKGEYGDCHRFDQSALAISLAQCSDQQSDYFHQSSIVAVQRM